MFALPPRPDCAFGTACPSRPGGREGGADICGWCKNMSLTALYDHAKSQPNKKHLTEIIDKYKYELENSNEVRASKGWSYVCASKDPKFFSHVWRSAFNPQNSRPCGTVRYQGQLCARCYDSAKQQGCAWLDEFDGDRFEFPCVFEDASLKRPEDRNWRIGPIGAQGRPDPDWEKDVRRHGRCERVARKKSLCQNCFSRMCEIKGFGRYFDTEWGKLRETYGL
jgi:hypothetical protein